MDAEPPLFSAFLYSPCVAVRVRRDGARRRHGCSFAFVVVEPPPAPCSIQEQWNQNTGHFPTSRLDAIQLISSLRYCNGRDCSYVLLVLFRLYGQRNRSYYTREIEDTILLASQKPEVYDDIARDTCCKFGIDRPQVVPVQGLPQVKGWENVECFFRYYFLEPYLNTTPLKKNEGRTLESWGFELLEVPHKKGGTGPSSDVAA
uniref:Uncharacterized protein n=2 Tax=Zea mays TaxID=4577 RepID=A0A804QXA0_MAIZE